ncbi:YolD-like family protein [Bacillus alkalicellulosilyticus]|uniref:YolD-like family protein n=1 Tax=Alkalihalobacterium alkalicellulosilyticum TaxID=1912214 RepID=UPI000996262A|nr:YolD-like family protein [Bacillus alkalicellulosilyticus]
MIRDRGNIKWTAMMLPEHVELLRELKEEQTRKGKPELDEQKLMEMNDTICEAMVDNEWLAFTYYENYDYHCLVGKVHYFDEMRKRLHIVDYFEEKHLLAIEYIVDVRVHDSL